MTRARRDGPGRGDPPPGAAAVVAVIVGGLMWLILVASSVAYWMVAHPTAAGVAS